MTRVIAATFRQPTTLHANFGNFAVSLASISRRSWRADSLPFHQNLGALYVAIPQLPVEQIDLLRRFISLSL